MILHVSHVQVNFIIFMPLPLPVPKFKIGDIVVIEHAYKDDFSSSVYKEIIKIYSVKCSNNQYADGTVWETVTYNNGVSYDRIARLATLHEIKEYTNPEVL